MEPQPELPPSKQPKRFFDIVPTHQTTPSPTSRPLVVTNPPLQPDPMMTAPLPNQSLESHEAQAPAVLLDNTLSSDVSSAASNDNVLPDQAAIIEEATHELPAGDDLADTLPDTTSMHTTAPLVSRPVVVGQAKRQHRSRWLMIGLLIAGVLVIGSDIILDSGAWQPSFHLPHTHFIKQ